MLGTRLASLLALGTLALGGVATLTGCAGATTETPPPPEAMVAVWNLTREGPSDESLNPATRSLTLTIGQDGTVVYSDDPGSPLTLRMIQSLGEPGDSGFRVGTAGLITESGAVIRISILMWENDTVLQITDNTRLSSPTRVQVFEKVS
jgi:hypothetical protein